MIRGFQEYLGRHMALTEEEQLQLSELAEVRSYDKKVRVTDIGEIDQHLNYVVRGLVRKFFVKGKEEVIKQISKEGTLVSSYVSYFSQVPSGYVVETLEPTILVSISFQNFESLFQSS
ncbi:MAG: hypothetical protein H7Y31_08875, partial [Chitinophagaceae bacterium]|nr:hypothetical protein [Chitinophagaceae bacterium]